MVQAYAEPPRVVPAPLWLPSSEISVPPRIKVYPFFTMQASAAPVPTVAAPPAAVWIPFPEPGRPPYVPRQWLFIVQTLADVKAFIATPDKDLLVVERGILFRGTTEKALRFKGIIESGLIFRGTSERDTEIST